jgi:hypothetical protein
LRHFYRLVGVELIEYNNLPFVINVTPMAGMKVAGESPVDSGPMNELGELNTVGFKPSPITIFPPSNDITVDPAAPRTLVIPSIGG